MNNKFDKLINWLVVATVFLLPWQTAYIFNETLINGSKSQYLTGQFHATELLLATIVIIWLANNWRLQNLFELIKSQHCFRTQNLFIIFLWLFLGYCGLSILWSSNLWASYYLWLHLLEASALTLIILNSKINRLNILWALLLASGLQGLLAINQFLSQNISANKWLGIAGHQASTLGDIVIETADGRWLRAYGSLAHPNILGGFLILGLISGLILWLENQKSRQQLLLILVTSLIISAGLFFSFSRSAWLCLMLILPLFTYFARKTLVGQEKRRFITLITGITAVFIALIFIFWPLVTVRSNLTNRLEAISASERLDQISQAKTIITSNLLFGTGINGYTSQLAINAPQLKAYQLQPIHNAYLLIMAELGLFGLAILLCFGYFIIKLSQKSSNFAIYFVPIFCFLIISLFDHYFWTQYSGLIMASLGLTILLKCIKISNQVP